MSYTMLSSEYESSLSREELARRSPFAYYEQSRKNPIYYRTTAPFCLNSTALRLETDAPMRLTVIAPDYSFHAVLDKEEFHTVIPSQKMHQHNTFELIFIIEGEFYQRIEHTIHKYVPGSCCLLSPNVRHIEDYSHNCRFVTLSLSPEFLNSMFSREQDFYFQMERERKETDLTRFISRYFKEPESAGKNYIDFIPQLGTDWAKENMHRIFDLLTQQILGPEIGTTFMVKTLVYKIFHFLDLEECYHTAPISLGNAAETALFSAVTKRLQETDGRISRSGLAKELNYSGSAISDVVKKFTGMSIFAYGTTFTMKEAARLLLTTSLSITEIALRLSFSDRTHFYKLFRESYGMTPKEYRKFHRNS